MTTSVLTPSMALRTVNGGIGAARKRSKCKIGYKLLHGLRGTSEFAPVSEELNPGVNGVTPYFR